jgi:pilus assembly protein Flp/PilA
MESSFGLLRDDHGATSVEYGLIMAAIAGLIIAVVYTLGNKVTNLFNNVQGDMP